MQFGFIGINYKRAKLEIRDQTSFTDTMKILLFQQAEEAGIDQCMVLSTCNRSEIYFFYRDEIQLIQMRKIYVGMFSAIDCEEYLVQLTGEEAINYLFRVAAGLESLVLGEDQILGQVKDAHDFSRTMGYSKKEMNKVVREAVTCAKKIKTELKVSEKPLSVCYIGIQKVNEAYNIKGKRVFIIGSGKTAVLALKYIYENQAEDVTLCNRTLEHARKLTKEFPMLKVVGYEERYEYMESCDIVISATSSPHLIVRMEEFHPVKKMVFLDLATPRDIDIRFSDLEQVTLINLDTLQQIVKENQKERERLVNESQSIMDESLEDIYAWLHASRMDSTIESLQHRCSNIVEDSYEYLNRKMDLGHREQKLLRKVLNASLQRLLKEPIQELRQIDTKEKQDEYKELVHQLFQIER